MSKRSRSSARRWSRPGRAVTRQPLGTTSTRGRRAARRCARSCRRRPRARAARAGAAAAAARRHRGRGLGESVPGSEPTPVAAPAGQRTGGAGRVRRVVRPGDHGGRARWCRARHRQGRRRPARPGRDRAHGPVSYQPAGPSLRAHLGAQRVAGDGRRPTRSPGGGDRGAARRPPAGPAGTAPPPGPARPRAAARPARRAGRAPSGWAVAGARPPCARTCADALDRAVRRGAAGPHGVARLDDLHVQRLRRPDAHRAAHRLDAQDVTRAARPPRAGPAPGRAAGRR